MNDTRRKEDNGIRKYTQRWTQPTSILATLVVIAWIASFIANLKMIPGLSKKIGKITIKVAIIETQYKADITYIKESIKEIKQLIKEK